MYPPEETYTAALQMSIPALGYSFSHIDSAESMPVQVTNTWIGVYEPYTADFLTERGIPCFDARSMLQLDPKSAPAHICALHAACWIAL